MSLVQLPPATVKLIGSSQVITSVSSVVKELMENSIDSGAQQIEIKLEKHGLEKIEVKDDGCGIEKSDVTVMCLTSYTSKISDFSDLDSLSSYGFRGEALSSLCNVANVSVTTKTAQDSVATCYTFDHNGQVTCSKTSHIVKGTIVTVTELFKKLPVRKQFMSNSKRAAEELKKIERLVKCLAVVHPRLRVTLVHNKFLCWQKTSVANLRQSVMQVVSLSMAKQLHHILHNTDQIRVEMLVPKSDCNIPSLCFSNFSDAHFLFVNQRPVRHKEMEKVVYDKLFEFFGVYMPVNKYPLCVTCLRVPPDCLDVNLEPNKTRVYLKEQENVLEIIKQCMHLYYGENKKETEEEDALKPVKKRKMESEQPEIDPKKEELSTPNSEKLQIQEKNVEDEPKSKDLDSAFVNYCLERKQNIEDSSVDKLVIKDVECTNASEGIKCSNVTSFFSSNCSDFVQKNVSSLEPYNNKNTSHIRIEQEMNNCDFTKENSKPSSKLEDSETFKEHLVLPGVENALETLHQEVNEIDIAYEHSTYLPRVENVDCDDAVDSEEDEMPLILEDSQCITTDSGKGSQEECSPTLSQWSRGEVTTSAGGFVKGSSVLSNAVEAVSPSISNESETQSIQICERSVTSQMGCKEMSAFTKFARNMRKRILEENPHMSFTRVAQHLQHKWRELDSDKKKTFEEGIQLKKAASPTAGQKQKTLVEMKQVHLLPTKTPNIELDITLGSLEQMVKRTRSMKEESNRLIGRLEASPLWLYRGPGTSVTVFSVPRLVEAVKFHQHLVNFALPSKLLDNYIPIHLSDIGHAQWSLLLSLERSPNGVVKDLRILNNGFVVEIGDTEAQLTYVPQHISHCGVEELQEVLQLFETHGPEATLDQCRPLRVISFLRSEVMRECSLQEHPTEDRDVSTLLSYWLSEVTHQTQSCIHHLPVIHRLNTP